MIKDFFEMMQSGHSGHFGSRVANFAGQKSVICLMISAKTFSVRKLCCAATLQRRFGGRVSGTHAKCCSTDATASFPHFACMIL